MKKLITFVLLALAAATFASCAGAMTRAPIASSASSAPALFQKSPEELMDLINSNIADSTDRFSPEYIESESYSNTLTRTYKSPSNNTLEFLLDSSFSDILAIRLILTDRNLVGSYLGSAKALAEISDEKINSDIVDEIALFFINYAKLKFDHKDIVFEGINCSFSFYQLGSDYVFALSNSADGAKGWGRTASFKKLAYSIGNDWQTYAEYEGIGEVYLLPSGLKVSIIVAPINIGLINLDLKTPIDLSKPQTVEDYLTESLEKTIEGLSSSNQGWTLAQNSKTSASLSGSPGLESIYIFNDSEGRPVMANKQATFLTNDFSYTIIIDRQSAFTNEDLKIYNDVLSSAVIAP
ncbi:MAG: hypothetical protein FWG30_03565 [Eubacteriaceae bacterium]|nr:hypothetical protein [Eubacteriaceae bacterium]